MTDSISSLLGRLRPIIELILAAHQVSPEESEEILEDLVRTLRFKRGTIADPAAWFVVALHRAVEKGKHPSSGTPEARKTARER